MHKVKISTDSISDLGSALLTKNNIAVMPLIITLGDETVYDNENMGQTIFDYVSRTNVLPKTGSRNIDEYINYFKKNLEGYDSLVHFTISSDMSSSYNFAYIASQEFDNVYVVDTKSLSTGSGLLVMYGVDLASTNTLSGSEIATLCDNRKQAVQASFILDNLDYLHKGGRCSGVAKFAAAFLKIKPMIAVHQGKMGVARKYRKKFDKAIIEYVNDLLDEYNTPDLKRVFITMTTAPQGIVDEIKEIISQKFKFEEIIVTTAGGTITSHCGKNTIGVLYFNDAVN